MAIELPLARLPLAALGAFLILALTGCGSHVATLKENPFLAELSGYDLVRHEELPGTKFAGQSDRILQIYYIEGTVSGVTDALKRRLQDVVSRTPGATLSASSPDGALAVIDDQNTSFSVSEGAPQNYPEQAPPRGQVAVVVVVSEVG